MASPVTTTLATHWINNNTVYEMIKMIKTETNDRYNITKQYLAAYNYSAHPNSFHLWLHLPKTIDINPSSVAAHLRSRGVNAVASAAFCTDNTPPHALRLCLGGSLNSKEWEETLVLITDILEHPAHLSSIGL